MNIDLKGKNALVCGSTAGIGKATAIGLSKLGANVTLLARNEDKLKSTLSELENNGSQKHGYLVADFSDVNSVKTKGQEYASNTDCHILVNNTGGPAGGPIAAAKPEEFINALNAHLINNQNLVQTLLPGMKKNNYGRIINVISTSVKAPIAGLGVSNTTRGAVANWAKTLSLEVGEFNITVNNVLPGFTDTDRLSSLISKKADKLDKSENELANSMRQTIPMKRFGTAEEVANAVVFLSSPAASYINGINVPVDGGRTQSL